MNKHISQALELQSQATLQAPSSAQLVSHADHAVPELEQPDHEQSSLPAAVCERHEVQAQA